MNVRALNFIKNMSYAFSANLISLIISTIVILIIPKIIGVEDYGYWQLYIFYSSYVGFLHLGWNDGIYLRYGGMNYSELNKKMFFSQFIMLLSSQIIFGIMIWIYSILFISNLDRSFIIKMVSLSMAIVNTRIMLLYILQATNRIKEYARATMSDRIFYIVLVIILMLIGEKDYKNMIFADLIGKFVSLVYTIIFCREIVLNKFKYFYLTFSEMYKNISVGIKLMFASIASMLIIGIVRFGIERTWDVATFGKISLTLSISNMMMIFINAVGIIIFPILRRTSQEKLASIYVTMRDFLMGILLGILVLYYPLKQIMVAWLPEYAESFYYMALVFPMFIYEGKIALLINTYFKTLRQEKALMRINIITMLLSLIVTYMSTQIFDDINLTVVNIVFLLVFKSTAAEIYLSSILKLRISKDIVLELFLTITFILTGWFIDSWYTMLIYGLIYISYLLIKRKDLLKMGKNIRGLVRA